jgi:predicted nucleotidyltransferase
VQSALRAWLVTVAASHPEARRIGYFGSYARGDWGVGSDLDVLVIAEESAVPFQRRAVRWDTRTLPVPTDLLVYTESEWRAMRDTGRWSEKISREVIWIYSRPDSSAAGPA